MRLCKGSSKVCSEMLLVLLLILVQIFYGSNADVYTVSGGTYNATDLIFGNASTNGIQINSVVSGKSNWTFNFQNMNSTACTTNSATQLFVNILGCTFVDTVISFSLSQGACSDMPCPVFAFLSQSTLVNTTIVVQGFACGSSKLLVHKANLTGSTITIPALLAVGSFSVELVSVNAVLFPGSTSPLIHLPNTQLQNTLNSQQLTIQGTFVDGRLSMAPVIQATTGAWNVSVTKSSFLVGSTAAVLNFGDQTTGQQVFNVMVALDSTQVTCGQLLVSQAQNSSMTLSASSIYCSGATCFSFLFSDSVNVQVGSNSLLSLVGAPPPGSDLFLFSVQQLQPTNVGETFSPSVRIAVSNASMKVVSTKVPLAGQAIQNDRLFGFNVFIYQTLTSRVSITMLNSTLSMVGNASSLVGIALSNANSFYPLSCGDILVQLAMIQSGITILAANASTATAIALHLAVGYCSTNPAEVARANSLLPTMMLGLNSSRISIVNNASGTQLVTPVATGIQLTWSVTALLNHVAQVTLTNSTVDVLSTGSTDTIAQGVILTSSTVAPMPFTSCNASMQYNGWNTSSGVAPSVNATYPLPVLWIAMAGGAVQVQAITTSSVGWVATAVATNVSATTDVNCTQPLRLNSSVGTTGGNMQLCRAVYGGNRVVNGSLLGNSSLSSAPFASSFNDQLCVVIANFSIPIPPATTTTAATTTVPMSAAAATGNPSGATATPTTWRPSTAMPSTSFATTPSNPTTTSIVSTTTSDPSTAPIVTPPPVVPFPFPSPQAAPTFMSNATLSSINSPDVHRIAIYISLVLLYEPAATALARLESFDVLAACPTLVRSKDVSPFALAIGGGRDEYLRGTVTASLLLILFVSVILLLLMIWISSICAKKVERPFVNVFLELCNILHFPSCTLCVTVAAVAQPAVTASVVLFGDSDKNSDFVFGMITFLYMFAYALAAGLLMSFLFRCHLRPVVKWTGVSELAPILGDQAILVKPLDLWMLPTPLNWQHPFERGWKQRYFAFFGIYRLPAYILIDFVFTCIIGIVLGGSTDSGTHTMCYVQASVVTAFSLVLAGLAAMGWSVLPMLPRLYIVIVNGTMVAAGLSTLVAISKDDSSAQNVSQAFKVGGVVITYMVLFVRLVFCISHFPRTLHRVRFWMDKRGHVTQLNFVPTADVDAENLAALLPDAQEEQEREMQVTALIEAAQSSREEQAQKIAKEKEQLESFLAEL